MNFNTVPDEQRPAFPGKHFGNALFDTIVFRVADRLIRDYRGGCWDYVELDADESGHVVAFMRLRGDRHTLVNPFSGESIEVDGNLAGMIVTSYALNYAIENGRELVDRMVSLNSAIWQYCKDTGQKAAWGALID